jgi:ABC-type glycerol-3-phosphate transport system permease component
VAGAMLSVIPVLIVYMFLQKHFAAGVALTGMKG